MIDYKFVKLIERIGYVNEYGRHIYGTAALLHFLRCTVEKHKPELYRNRKSIRRKSTVCLI